MVIKDINILEHPYSIDGIYYNLDIFSDNNIINNICQQFNNLSINETQVKRHIYNKNNLIKVRDFTNNKIINKSDYIYKFNPYNNKWLRDDWENRYKLNSPPLIYNYSWFNPLYWNSPVCKRGCIQTDIGQWGCQYPGYSSNDCFFASDCRGC